ncbi:MAG: DUF1800 family protein [Paracoccaceae bacterium]
MRFSPELAEKRFGCGLSPEIDRPTGVTDMLRGLQGPDVVADAIPIEDFDTFRERMIKNAVHLKNMRKTRGTDEFKIHKGHRDGMNRQARKDKIAWYVQSLSRWAQTPTGFRERLAAFWGDHFTARGKQGLVRRATSPFIESAIRPHLAGRFEDLLIAAITHPMMLIYLDQLQSVGPNSAFGTRKKKRNRGLNENLSRELLELHTVGTQGGYTQSDVRELAELLTGLSFRVEEGTVFAPDRAEPGAETVLGRTYGDDPATMAPIHDVLRDLARHPATARHLAWKLAVHFVSDGPDPGLVQAMEDRYRATDGDLSEVYAAMLDHPAAWDPVLHNVKPPFDFMASACRALAVDPEKMKGLKRKNHTVMLLDPMRLMGQDWQRPPGPDGWPEEDAAWITPQGLSARLRWAMVVPANLRRALPDPREFVDWALGADVPEAVRFAAEAAERRMDGIGLILASPAFQRR